MAVNLADSERRIRARVEEELAARVAGRETTRLQLADQDWVYQLVGRLVTEEHRRAESELAPGDCERLWRRVFGAVTPLGPLAEHLADPEVEEVRLNGTEACFVLKQGRRLRVPPPFADESALVELVHWYADALGTARIDRSSPTVTLTLPDGSRLHAALSPPARPMSVTIRRHPPSRFRDLADLAAVDFLPEAAIDFLSAAVRGRLNVLVAGGTGAGKTTVMRVLCGLIPEHERVVSIEDQAELHLWQALNDCISLEGRSANAEGKGAISIEMLVHEALRMSPDRIVIGEVRGGEALDLLDAMNTGHPGSICTIHSETPRDTLPRLARLALRNAHAPRLEAILAEVVRSVDLVLQMGMSTEGGTRRRYLSSIGFVVGLEGDRPVVEELMTGDPETGWTLHLAASALPDRIRTKLARAGDLDRLMRPAGA